MRSAGWELISSSVVRNGTPGRQEGRVLVQARSPVLLGNLLYKRQAVANINQAIQQQQQNHNSNGQRRQDVEQMGSNNKKPEDPKIQEEVPTTKMTTRKPKRRQQRQQRHSNDNRAPVFRKEDANDEEVWPQQSVLIEQEINGWCGCRYLLSASSFGRSQPASSLFLRSVLVS